MSIGPAEESRRNQTAAQQTFMVGAYQHQADDPVVFTFTPRGLQQARGQGGVPKRVPQYRVAVRGTSEKLDFDWVGTPDDPGSARTEIEAEVTVRMRERAAWIGRVTDLMTEVEEWARELGWSTKRVEKKLDDARVGSHRVPALLMQAETCRMILEPVGRSTPGSEGVVDLYLMPAYDDVASIDYYEGRWNLHYVFPGDGVVKSPREADALALSKEVLERVLAEMREHAH